MAIPAQGREIRERVARPAVVERDHVIALEPPGSAALPAPPPVPIEHGPADDLPSPIRQPKMVQAHELGL